MLAHRLHMTLPINLLETASSWGDQILEAFLGPDTRKTAHYSQTKGIIIIAVEHWICFWLLLAIYRVMTTKPGSVPEVSIIQCSHDSPLGMASKSRPGN
jgi:hypothetical protein